VTVCGQDAMADGEDADVHTMQAAGPQAMLDSAGVEPERSELPMGDDAVLPCRERREGSIGGDGSIARDRSIC
jgi:hypothetical protein